VERTFSAQGSIHTKKRNRLLNQSVQDEMCVKFNKRALDRKTDHYEQNTISDINAAAGCVQLLPASELNGAAAQPAVTQSDSDAETDVHSDGEQSVHESTGAHNAGAAAAGPLRSQSQIDDKMRKVLEAYITEHTVTLHCFKKNSRYWNNDRQNALQAALFAGGYVITDAIDMIKQILEEQHD
jgi:hypothetical protein